MSRPDATQRLMPSILDRLIDPASGGTASLQGYSVEQMTEAVRRDLEELLNSRRTSAGIDPIYVETLRSVIGYGLPDFASVDTATAGARSAIGRLMENVIAIHEPRLRHVRASLIESARKEDRSVRFEIQARLAVDPSPEVGFETVMELMTGHTTIKQQNV